MEARIVEFAEVLRQNGVRVATSELLDASRAATLVDLSDREAFRAVLRTTMVKRSADRAPLGSWSRRGRTCHNLPPKGGTQRTVRSVELENER